MSITTLNAKIFQQHFKSQYFHLNVWYMACSALHVILYYLDCPCSIYNAKVCYKKTIVSRPHRSYPQDWVTWSNHGNQAYQLARYNRRKVKNIGLSLLYVQKWHQLKVLIKNVGYQLKIVRKYTNYDKNDIFWGIQ